MMCSTACRNDEMFAIIVPQGTHCSAKPSSLGVALIILPKANIIWRSAKADLQPTRAPLEGEKTPDSKILAPLFKGLLTSLFYFCIMVLSGYQAKEDPP